MSGLIEIFQTHSKHDHVIIAEAPAGSADIRDLYLNNPRRRNFSMERLRPKNKRAYTWPVLLKYLHALKQPSI